MPLTTPALHHRHRGSSISGQTCLPERHQQRSFFSTTLSWTTMDCVIRREIVVARSGGFSEIVVARSGGFRDDWWIRMSLVFAQKIYYFRSSVSSLRWLCWSRERLMASVAYSRTKRHQHFFIAHKMNSCDLICSVTSSSTEPSTGGTPSPRK